MEEVHWYSNPEWWAVFISVIALVASLGPILRKVLKRPRVEIELFDSISIGHSVGNPNAFLNVLVRNTGGKDLRIRKLWLDISRNSRGVMDLAGSRYFDKPTDQNPVVFMSVPLNSGDEWSHAIQFFNPLDRDVDDRVRRATNALRENINRKRVALPPQAAQEIVPADEGLIDPLIDIFDDLFVWTRGEYTVTLRLETLPVTKAVAEFHFTLYESDETHLRNQSLRFDTGEGVYWWPPQSPYLAIPLTSR